MVIQGAFNIGETNVKQIDKIKAMDIDEMANFLTTCARYHCIPLNPLKCGANTFDEENFLYAKECVMKLLESEVRE